MKLKGKRALVTGAGRGAGWGIALELADAGADVAVCDLNEETAAATSKEIAKTGVRTLYTVTDVSDETAVREMFDRVVRELGGLDILVNTVAWIDPPGPIINLPYDRWTRTVRTNLDSVFLCSKYALQVMVPNKSGFIVSISSVNGTRGFPNRAGYGATKAALLNLTETIAMENREFGIRANVLVPGGIEGERGKILRQLAEEAGIAFAANIPQFDPPLKALHPRQLGKYVVFLASDDGEPINGQALWIGEAPAFGTQVLF